MSASRVVARQVTKTTAAMPTETIRALSRAPGGPAPDQRWPPLRGGCLGSLLRVPAGHLYFLYFWVWAGWVVSS